MRLLPILFVNDNPIAAVSVLFDRHANTSIRSKKGWLFTDAVGNRAGYASEAVIVRIRCSIKIDEPCFLCNFSLR